MDHLPSELILEIALLLPDPDLTMFIKTSPYLRNLLRNSNFFWRQKLLQSVSESGRQYCQHVDGIDYNEHIMECTFGPPCPIFTELNKSLMELQKERIMRLQN